jgi:small GTP-binding protein
MQQAKPPVQRSPRSTASRKSVAPVLKLVLLGSSLVGKTTLFQRFIDPLAPKREDGTITEKGKNDATWTELIEGVSVEVWDTAGHERFDSLTKSYLRGAHGFIMVYDVTSQQSLKDITEKWFPMIMGQTWSVALPKFSYLLVGNKSDLEKQRVLQCQKTKMLAQSKGWHWYETCAHSADPRWRQAVIEFIADIRTSLGPSVFPDRASTFLYKPNGDSVRLGIPLNREGSNSDTTVNNPKPSCFC